MRVYVPASLDDLDALIGGEELTTEQLVAASEDEEDELAALEAAADAGAVAIAADVDAVDDPVTWAVVASLHLDVDGSGHLAWYDPSEVAAVRALLS